MASHKTSGALQQSRKFHAYKDELHHPFVEVMQHLISPLTASLTIFAVHKTGQLHAIRSWIRAVCIQYRHRRGGFPSGQPQNAAAATQKRQYSTFTRAASELNASASAVTRSNALKNQFPAWNYQASLFARQTLPGYRSMSTIACRSAAALQDVTATNQDITATVTMPSRFFSKLKQLGLPMLAAAPVTAAHSVPEVTAFPPTSPGDIGTTEIAYETVLKLQEMYAPEDAQMVAQHLTNWWTVKQVEQGLQWIHESMGLPWWGTIIVATLALRTVLAPVNIALLRNTLRMKLIAPQVKTLEDRMKKGKSEAEKVTAAEDLKQLFKEGKCHPLKNFITFPILLPPTILSIFGAIHNLSMSEPDMAVEGFAFFPDLVQADPTNLLPIASAMSWLANVESGAGVFYHSRPYLKTMVRTTACMCWALSATMPSGVLIFWVTSNLFAIARGYVTRFDSVRKALNIPLQSEIAKLPHLPKPTDF